MTKKDIEEKIKNIFQQTCGIEKDISPQDNLYEDLELDSVGLLTLAAEIENQFQIFLPSSEEDIPQTVRELIDFIEREGKREDKRIRP